MKPIQIAALGVLVFIVAMVTMRDSWRVGIPEKDKIELITKPEEIAVFEYVLHAIKATGFCGSGVNDIEVVTGN